MGKKSRILDELLVIKAQGGDYSAIDILVRKWNHKLLYQSYIRTKDWEESKDIVQDVWQWCLTNLYKLKDPAKFSTWIRTVVDRRSIDLIRKKQSIRKKEPEVKEAQLENAEKSTDEKENMIDLLREELQNLKPESQLILTLHYLESNSVIAISKVLDIPIGTVKSRLYHAREQLKRLLQEELMDKEF